MRPIPEEGEIFLLDKPYRWSSFDVVNFVRNVFRKDLGIPKVKVGHAGTLDPLATGLLILCTGKKTKDIEQFQELEKEYTGIFRFGATTPSFDLETETDKEFPFEHITAGSLENAAVSLTGTYDQVPPVFSAKKVEGKRAYKYARKNKEVTLQPRRITIHSFDITGIRLPDVAFRIVCSKGTYIRALARDLGEMLDSGVHLTALCRTRIGQYRLEDALGPEAFREHLLADSPKYNNE